MTAIRDAVKLYRQQRGMGLTAVEAAEWNGRWMWAAFGDLYGRIVPPAPDEGSRWWAAIRPEPTEEKSMSDELLNWIASAPLPPVPQESRELDTRAPALLWRAWDREWRQVGAWDEQPPLSALVDGGGLTVDYPNGFRKSWRVYGGELRDETDFLRKMEWPSNSFLSEDTDETGMP